MPLYSAGRFTIAIASGSVAASVSISMTVLRRAGTSRRVSMAKVLTTAPPIRISITSGNCSANSVGR